VQEAQTATQTNTGQVEIDLTNHDDDDVVIVKTEQSVGPDRKSNEVTEKHTGTIGDLRYQLKRIQRQKRMLELDQEEAEVKRKLAKHSVGKMASKSVKMESLE